jgi:dethiobiotin synthetase
MTKGYFVTGTDTGVGKTLIASALMLGQKALGHRVTGMKPIASGCRITAQGLRNEDALLLLEHASEPQPYSLVNPYAFEPPIAPHLAAQAIGVAIELPRLIAAYRSLAADADVVIVEGAGGWRVPLGRAAFLSDVPESLGLGVILVVGLRLGCLNHALLTSESIVRGGKSKLVGWIGNGIDPQFAPLNDNINALRELLPAPCLGVVPPLQLATAEAALSWLDAMP